MISQQLKKYREEVGATQEEFAMKLGCTRQYYSALETGKRTPGTTKLAEIAKALGISTTYLLAETCKPTSKIKIVAGKGKYLMKTRKGFVCLADHCEWRDHNGVCGSGAGCLKEWSERCNILKARSDKK